MATNPNSETWVNDIVGVVRDAGGVATLSTIYAGVARRRKAPLPPSWQAVIRRIIQTHSSDSSDWTGNFTDLFYSASDYGGGVWGLRSMGREPMTDEEVKATRKQVTHLMRHPNHHPSRFVPELVHYALDLESPPLIACESPDAAKWDADPGQVTCPDCMTHDEFPRSAAAQAVEDLTEPPAITANDVLMVAADLLVDANYDYTKAIVDMTSQLLGAGPHDTILMTRILRSLAQGD